MKLPQTLPCIDPVTGQRWDDLAVEAARQARACDTPAARVYFWRRAAELWTRAAQGSIGNQRRQRYEDAAAHCLQRAVSAEAETTTEAP